MTRQTPAKGLGACLLIAGLVAVLVRPARSAGSAVSIPVSGQATPCADTACVGSSFSVIRVFVFIHNNSSASFQLASFGTFDHNTLTEPVPTSIAPKTNAEFANVVLQEHAAVGGHVQYTVTGGQRLNIDYASDFATTASVTPQGGNDNVPYCSLDFGTVSVGGAAITVTFSDSPSSIFDTRGICVGVGRLIGATSTPSAGTSTPDPTRSPATSAQPPTAMADTTPTAASTP
jgi:hypothetical protein